ncbi:MAG TPA: divalent metal cation transporter [Sphingomicrobium sp.]|nr:divalent metal cation transporter [Sphingomicrobium sp.]
MNPLELTLGIMTAVGGFVDISQLVFSAQAGSLFGYALIAAFAISTLGIMVFGEMCGRVAAVAHQPVFSLIRHRLGLNLGLFTLGASVFSTVITCAAEVGGMGLILNLLTGAPYRLMCVTSVLLLIASMWILPFKWIERSFGLLGLFMIIFLVALVALHPPWEQVANGFVPQVPHGLSPKKLLTYAYFVVAIFSAVMFPYEAYFYSSGGIEERWGPKDLLTNRVTSIVGMALGTLLSIAIVAIAAQIFAPVNVGPVTPGSVALQGAIPFGKTGLVLALLGMFFAVAGAAVETGMASAYSIAQFFGWEWGRRKKPWEAPRFTLTWILVMLIAVAVVLSGMAVMDLVNYSIVFSIVVLPLSYFPLMLLASDKSYMGSYANKWLANGLGWTFLLIVTIAAIAAVPLYLLTSGGQA